MSFSDATDQLNNLDLAEGPAKQDYSRYRSSESYVPVESGGRTSQNIPDERTPAADETEEASLTKPPALQQATQLLGKRLKAMRSR